MWRERSGFAVMNGESAATRTRNTPILVIQSRGSSRNEDLAAHGGIVEVGRFGERVRSW